MQLCYKKLSEALVRSVLLIVSVNMLMNWEEEFEKWVGSLVPMLKIYYVSRMEQNVFSNGIEDNDDRWAKPLETLIYAGCSSPISLCSMTLSPAGRGLFSTISTGFSRASSWSFSAASSAFSQMMHVLLTFCIHHCF